MSDELNVWRDACFAYGGASIEGAELEPLAAAEIERLRTALRQIQDEGDARANAIATATLGGSDAE